MLALRDRSRKEVEGRLFEKDYTREIVDQVLREMEFLGYIDDVRYALKFASDAVRRRNSGPAAIRYGLQQKGIDRGIIEEAVGKVFQDNDEKEVARKALRKRHPHPTPPPAPDQGGREKGGGSATSRDEIRKLSDYLRRKGFSYDIIKETLKEIGKEDDI